MANATAINPVNLAANGSIAAPTAQVLDTGTAAVTLETAAAEQTDRIVVEVTNTAAANLTVTAVTGEDPPAGRSALGDVTSANIAQNGRRIFGPFESAHFRRANGKLRLTFTPASGTINATFVAYRLPRTT